MANLTAKIEVAFTADPANPTPGWTDISAYVDMTAGVKITRGRADQFSTVSAGNVTATLNNNGGAFTPGKVSGSAFGQYCKRGKRVRISVTDGTTTWIRFVGFVTAWGPMQWSATGLVCDMPLTLTDRLASLENLELSTIIGNEILYLNPVVYFPLGDPENSTTVADMSGQLVSHPGSVIDGPVIFGTATGPPTDDLTAAQFIGGSSRGAVYVDDQGGLVPANHDWSYFVFVNTSVTPPGIQMPFIALFTDDSTYSSSMAIGIMGELNLLDKDSNVLIGGATTFADGLTHSCAVTYTAATDTVELFADGFSLGTATLADIGKIVGFRIGSLENGLYQRFTGVEAHAALFDTAVADTDILAMHEAGDPLANIETSGSRLARLAKFAGIDSADYTFSGVATVDIQDTTGQTPLAAMRQVEDTEASPLYVNHLGQLAMESRLLRYNQAASVTLAVGQYEDDLQPVLDDLGMANDAVVTSTINNDLKARYTDLASVADQGLRSKSVSIVSQDTKTIQERAQHEATINSDPPLRWPTVTVDLMTQTSLRSSVFGLEIGDRIDLSGLPSSALASTTSLLVEGMVESYTINDALVTFNCSPAPRSVLMVGSATYGHLDQNYLAL